MDEQVRATRDTIRGQIRTKFRNVQRFGVVAKRSPDWVYKRLYYPTAEGLAELSELVEKTPDAPTNYELTEQDRERIVAAVHTRRKRAGMTETEWMKANGIDPNWWTYRFENIRLKSSEQLQKLVKVLEIQL